MWSPASLAKSLARSLARLTKRFEWCLLPGFITRVMEITGMDPFHTLWAESYGKGFHAAPDKLVIVWKQCN